MTPNLHGVFCGVGCGKTLDLEDGSLAAIVPASASAPAPRAALRMNSLLFTPLDCNSSFSLSWAIASNLRKDELLICCGLFQRFSSAFAFKASFARLSGAKLALKEHKRL
jgi:hypothetical protein